MSPDQEADWWNVDCRGCVRPAVKPPRSVLLAATLALCAALTGCAASEDSAAVTVVLTSGSQLADAPSAFTVLIASAGSGEEVRSTVTEAVTVEEDGLILLDDALPPGRYRLEAAQQECKTDGNDCPDDPSSSEFAPAQHWQCAVSFEATTSRPTRVEIVEGPDPDVTEQRVCRVVA